RYRPVIPLPFNLVERVRVAFEEMLHEQGIELLNAVLFTGISTPGPPVPALIPPPTFLRFLLTLMVHPFYTTQIRKNMPPSRAPTDAHILMRRIIDIIGPLNADLGVVWRFDRSGRTERRRHKEKEMPPSSDDTISGELANEESLFSQAEDVWSIVGWAFTCSVSHPSRWTWWKHILDCLIETLEADWQQRWESFENGQQKRKDLLEESMIVKMLPDTKGTGGYRRVIRAILATGTGQWASEFTSVWEDELLKKRQKKKGRRGLDSYMGEDDSAEDEKESVNQELDENNEPVVGSDGDVQMQNSNNTRSLSNELGGMEAFLLRQRFFTLLSNIGSHGQFISPLELYHEIKDYISQYSLRTFKLFVTTLVPVDDGYQNTFNQVILESLLSGEAPPAKRGEDFDLTQEVLIRRFLPYTAKTQSVVDNAKFTIVLEVLVRLLFRKGYLVWSQELEDAVERGIAARKNKVSGSSKGKDAKYNEDMDEVNRQWEVADNCLRLMIKLVKAKHE
ncbi:hypothetical protein BDD12DRAFT_699430, partial [Trichophaea hybrida]